MNLEDAYEELCDARSLTSIALKKLMVVVKSHPDVSVYLKAISLKLTQVDLTLGSLVQRDFEKVIDEETNEPS